MGLPSQRGKQRPHRELPLVYAKRLGEQGKFCFQSSGASCKKTDMIVKDILYRNEDIDYGLNVIFKLDDNTFLLFDSIGFSFVEKANLLDNKWKHCSYWKNKSQINGIYEDELTAYFVVFSNGDILYIYINPLVEMKKLDKKCVSFCQMIRIIMT